MRASGKIPAFMKGFPAYLREAGYYTAYRGKWHLTREFETTLIRIVCGLLPAESGTVHWRGKVVRSSNDDFHIEMAYLGHLNSLKADLTARENLRFFMRLHEVDEAAA